MTWPCLNPECDAVFDSRRDAGTHYYTQHGESYTDALVVSRFDQLPEDFYRTQYHRENKTLGEIADMLGVSNVAIHRRMKAHGIPRNRGQPETGDDGDSRGLVARKRAELDAHDPA